nr:MAG TPA: hypothetical protein [Caudoviricetes sp.]
MFFKSFKDNKTHIPRSSHDIVVLEQRDNCPIVVRPWWPDIVIGVKLVEDYNRDTVQVITEPGGAHKIVKPRNAYGVYKAVSDDLLVPMVCVNDGKLIVRIVDGYVSLCSGYPDKFRLIGDTLETHGLGACLLNTATIADYHMKPYKNDYTCSLKDGDYMLAVTTGTNSVFLEVEKELS